MGVLFLYANPDFQLQHRRWWKLLITLFHAGEGAGLTTPKTPTTPTTPTFINTITHKNQNLCCW